MLSRLRAALVGRLVGPGYDYEARAVPLTPTDEIPPDQGDARSRPTEEEVRRALRDSGWR